jgi:hypothetical protein
MTEFNPETMTVPKKLLDRKFLTFKEFGSLVGGLQAQTIRKWYHKGIIQAVRITPRCTMIPSTELDRLVRGELMDTENTR